MDNIEIRKETIYSHLNLETGLEIKMCVFISASNVPDLSEDVQNNLPLHHCTGIFKDNNTPKSILMDPRDKVPSNLKRTLVHKWSCPEQNCNQFYICESSRCLEVE